MHWLGYGDEHNTFEPADNLTNADEEVQEYWLKHSKTDWLRLPNLHEVCTDQSSLQTDAIS